MNEAPGPPCLLWRRCDPEPDADEDACWIGSRLARYLSRQPQIGFVEENQEETDVFRTREGTSLKPGSLFRWWYPLPWSYERRGVRVVNPNAVWVAVRDKLAGYGHLAGAQHFRVPRSFAVESTRDAAEVLARYSELFEEGFVLKPRVGFGGHGVRVGYPGDWPWDVPPNSMLCERIVPPPASGGRFWDVRLFVMAGKYCGGVRRSSERPVTNVFQGGRAERLEEKLAADLEPAALEAVRMLDRAAAAIHSLPQPPEGPLTRVVW
jgi:glutathione synthase/RimK-type ligase-like ATP-grasp enzyme